MPMSYSKLLITGCRGQLGSDLVKLLSPSYEIYGIDQEECDITKHDKLQDHFKKFNPDLVIHTAAYTDVDGCENNQELAFLVNQTGTENIAKLCREHQASLIYYSTDYVFDGESKIPYVESDKPNPKTIYGQSKLAGEKVIVKYLDNFAIMRLAWVYGITGNNFVKTMIRLAKKNSQSNSGKLRVVNDQFGSPSWTEQIVGQTEVVIENNLKGLFHCTSEGTTTWYDFARLIFKELSLDVKIEQCSSCEYKRLAPRPHYSVLENGELKKIGLNKMINYDQALREFIKINMEKLLNEM